MGLLGSLGGLLGGVAGNALLPGIGGAIGSALGSSLGGSKGGSGSSSGGSNNAYIPSQRPEVDQNFLYNKGQYESALNQQQNATQGYNNQLLQGQFNNPYAGNALQGANWAQQDYYNNANQANALSAGNYAYANQQMQNAQQQQQLYQQGLGNVQNSVSGLYGLANQSNQTYQDLMNYQKGQLGNITQSQNNLYSGGNQVLQTALDPQKDLYNRTSQQLTDQTRAAQYARGIQSSPLGASVESNALGNFNIDWQNQQLARQSQGLQSAQGAYGSAQGLGNSYTNTQAGLQAGQNQQYAGLTNAAQSQYTNYLGAINQSNAQNTQNISGAQQNAFGLGQQVAGAVQQGAQIPYQTNQNIYGNQNQALQNYQGNNQQYFQGLNQLQSNDLSYLNFGQGAQNQAFNQNQTNQQNIGKALGATNFSGIGNTISGWFGGGQSGGQLANPGQAPTGYDWGSMAAAYG